MKNSLSKARSFIEEINSRPLMFAVTKEAFLATIHTCLWFSDINIDAPWFYKQHLSSGVSNIRENFDDAWAHKVCEHALYIMEMEDVKSAI